MHGWDSGSWGTRVSDDEGMLNGSPIGNNRRYHDKHIICKHAEGYGICAIYTMGMSVYFPAGMRGYDDVTSYMTGMSVWHAGYVAIYATGMSVAMYMTGMILCFSAAIVQVSCTMGF